MDILLGFGGRIGRLSYFLLSLLLGVVMTILVLTLVFALAPHYALADGSAPKEVPTGMVLIILAIVAPIFLWFSLALQAKRFRDIGWNPLYAILGWIGVGIVDRCVAFLIPALAIGEGSGTAVGALINVVMVCCLLFWPGRGGDDSDWDARVPEAGRPQPTAARPLPVVSVPPASIPATAPVGFGRRKS